MKACLCIEFLNYSGNYGHKMQDVVDDDEEELN